MRVALVHDYLTQYGGAERVLEVLHNHFPDAPVFTSLHDPAHLPDAFRDWDIHVSPLQRIPGATRSHRLWTLLYPAMFAHLGFHDVRDVDIVIATSSAWAHHIRPRRDIPVICYCHSPARFLYGDPNYLDPAKIPGPIRPLANGMFRVMREFDTRAARHLTHVIANSGAVRERICEQWGVDATVIHPPIEVERFQPTSPVEIEDWFLVVSRLVPHKWIDRAIHACTVASIPLKVIGSGRSTRYLRNMAGPTIEFLGEQPDAVVVDHMQRCRALILPGIEDFGMTAVEAQAAGRPVFAARGGGALETVIPGVTGMLFDPTKPEELIALMQQDHIWDTQTIQHNAEQYDTSIFLQKIDALVADVM